MNIKLNFNEQFNSIDVIYPINYSDRLDGLQDTISCEFYLNDDLLPYYHKHQKIIIDILDDENNILKEFRMCATDLNRELCSTYDKNTAYTYRYTLTACEPTILINENIRTDITITPYLYHGNEYTNLIDAVTKIISCHNMNNKNEPIYWYYRKWSMNSSKLYDNQDYIIGADCNFYLNGKLTGGYVHTHKYVHQTGTTTDVTATVPSVEFNNEIITEFPYSVSRTFVATITETIEIEGLEPITTTRTENQTITFTLDLNGITATISQVQPRGLYWKNMDVNLQYKPADVSLFDLLSSVPCPSLTYQDLSTYSQLEDVFNRVGVVPYLDFNSEYKCFLTCYSLQGKYEDNEYSTISKLSNEEIAKLNDYTSNSVSAQIKNISCDTEEITFPSQFSYVLKVNDYSNNISYNLPNLFSTFQEGIYKVDDYKFQELTMLCPNTYDEQSRSIQDPNQYYLELPTNIENILYLYQIIPSGENSSSVTLKKLNTDKLIEYSIWQNLPASQQKLYAYFVRGENKIRQFISLLEDVMDLSGDWAWSNGNCYRAVRKGRFICVYRPMINLSYSYYTYKTLNDKTTKNIDLPYKAISDKQISNILGYEYEKQTSNKISYKLITNNLSEVIPHYAGEKIYYKNRRFREDNYLGTFETLNTLNNQYNPITNNDVTLNSWAIIGEDTIYVVDKSNRYWKSYIGEPCVITKMDVVINKNSIEVSYELNTDIAQNSIVTGYSDNVRVSDNLSTETTVNREINIYKTFLLNCTSSYTNSNNGLVCPSKVFNNDLYLNGVDNLLLASGLKYFRCFSQSNELNVSDVNKVNHLNLLFDTGKTNPTTPEMDYDTFASIGTYNASDDYFANMSDTRIYVTQEVNSITGETYIVWSGIVYETDGLGYPTGNAFFNYNYSFSDFEMSNLISGRYTLRYEYTNPYLVELMLNKSGVDTRLKYWELDRLTYPTNYCRGSENTLRESNLISHSSPYFIHSNNISRMTFNCINPATLGNYAVGYDSKMFNKSMPLYYKESFVNSKFLGIAGRGCYYTGQTKENVDLTRFEKLINQYGCCDLKVDMREEPSVNIQYIVTPNNYNDFYKNNYDNMSNIYTIDQKYICSIKEINTNIQWMNNVDYISYSNIKNSDIIFKRVPKTLTMAEYLLNQSNYSQYCTATGSIAQNEISSNSDFQRTYQIIISASENLSNNADQYNYILIKKETDGTETPLMIIDTFGCEFPYNKINISYFLI